MQNKSGKSEESTVAKTQITKRSIGGRKPGLVAWIWRLEGLKGEKIVIVAGNLG